MVGWGADIVGLEAVISTFEAIEEKLDPAVWSVGTPVYYSVYVEFGTYKMAAEPYLRPAVEHANRNLQSIVKNAETFPDAVKRIALEIERYAKSICPVDTGTLRASIHAEEIS